MNALSKQLSASDDTYKVIGISTAHISEYDAQRLTHMANDEDEFMVANRGSGWFLKLYSDREFNVRNTFSDELNQLILACFDAGFLMIEFDRDATQYAGLTIYEM